MWMGPNGELVKTLDDYCYGKDSFRFALMIRGNWGSGKTWLVDRFFEEKRQNRKNDDVIWKPLRVSLFGASSSTDIGEALYAELHPLLAGKPGQVGSFVVRSLLKTTLRIDFNELVERKDNGKSSGNVTLAGADLRARGENRKPKRRIIVFDDLERASMPVTDILAAIHPLVDGGDNRVILLVNEEEIKHLSEVENERYQRAKEKTVFLTLEVEPDFKSALAAISNNIKNSNFREFVQTLIKHFEPMVKNSGAANLRLLSVFVHLGEVLFNSIKTDYRTNSHYEALSELFMFVYVALIENRVHGVSFEDFGACINRPLKLSNARIQHDESQASSVKQNLEVIRGRLQVYPYSVLHSRLIQLDDLDSLVMRGTVRAVSINRNLALDSRFTKETERPSWVRVWDYACSSAEEVKKSVTAFISDFKARAFVELDMLHACSIYLTLYRVGEIDIGNDDPVLATKSYISDVFSRKNVTEKDIKSNISLSSASVFAPFGRQFTEEGTPKFNEVKEFYFKQRKLWLDSEVKRKAETFNDLLRNDFEKFLAIVFGFANSTALYQHTPILQHLDTDEFSRNIIRLPANHRIYLIQCLKERFENTVYSGNSLHPEFEWFRRLSISLDAMTTQADGSSLFKVGLRGTFSPLQDIIDNTPSNRVPTF